MSTEDIGETYTAADVEEVRRQIASRPPPPIVGSLVKCSCCGNEILIEQVLVGSNHAASVVATCWKCLSPEKQAEAKKTYSFP